MRKSPGFAAVAVLTLALGIGTSTIIFSVVYNGVLYPFPFRSAELELRDIRLRSNILQWMLRRGLTLILAGIDIGLVASISLTRLMASQFRGISATDSLTLRFVVAAVFGVGLTACLSPARCATRVDPMVTLRYE